MSILCFELDFCFKKPWTCATVLVSLSGEVQLSLTCTWSNSMPAITMPSPASRYEGSTWRKITLEDSLYEMWSFSSSILFGQLLRFTSGLHICQLFVLIQVKVLPTRRVQYCLSFSLSACPDLFYT